MKILVTGDYYPLSRVKQLVDNGAYDEVFKYIMPVIKQNDYSIINLEAPVVISKCKPIFKIGPNMKCSVSAVEAIKYAGFNMVTLANNHFFDYGQHGVDDTFMTLEQFGIDKVGAGSVLSEAEKIEIKEIAGETVAIVNICENEFSIATKNSGGSNPLDMVKIYYQIQDTRKNVDYILVIIHGGHEAYQYPSPRMKSLYRLFVDLGADAVICHHQHCFSGYEIYNNKPIFYGLGNLSFDKNNGKESDWNKGYMVSIDFQKNNIQYKIHPYVQGLKEPGVVLLANEYDDEIDAINLVIADDHALSQKFEEHVKKRRLPVLSAITPFSNKYINALYKRKLFPSFVSRKKKCLVRNIINCESHRDVILNILRDDSNTH